MTTAKALEGLVVLEAGGRGAVAVCGSLLAQLGATVIVVEHPAGSPKAVQRAQYCAGKLSLKPDPKNAGDRALLEQLILGSDVVLGSSDLDPAWMGAADTHSPHNVVCDITAFGRTGPLAGKPLSELGVQAMSGIMDTTGFPDGPPVPIRVPIVDVIAGTYATTAVLAALRVKHLQGAGQLVDIGLFDGAFAALRSFLTTVLTSDKSDTSRLGNRHPTVRPWNLYRSRDGYVLICAGNTYAMYERLCQLIGRAEIAPKYPTQKSRIEGTPEIDPAIESWTQQFTTAECVEKLLAVGVVSGPIVPVADYPREANLEFRGMVQHAFDPVSGRDIFVPGSPLRMSVTPGMNLTRIPPVDADRPEVATIAARLPRPSASPAAQPKKRALDGIRIVEFGQYTTAPMCARELAHLGAEVIKIEQPTAAEARSGAEVSFRMNNADKKTMVIDLKDPFDVEALRRLLATADVLVENLKPGTLSKFGFTPKEIEAINPRLIYCPISGFGTDSLYPTRPAFDMVIAAMAGFMTVLSADGFPLKSGISTSDLMGAEMAMSAILAAIGHLDRSGQGQVIDLSMQDISAWLTQTSWNGAFDGRIEPAVVQAADGYVLVEAGEAALAEALAGRPHGVPARDGFVQLTREALAEALRRAGIEAVPVQTVREAATMPHTRERKLWFTMREDGEDLPMLGSPLRLTVTPPTVTHLALPMNHDRQAILDELGLTQPA
ncbi:MAG: CoA transferase [Rhizobiaceae bacterium]|nr:CoA transferase [Rhizobiaceae bacterium]